MTSLKIISSLLLVALISGCVTQKKCLQKFPVQEIHDTLIVYHDTIITVPVLGTDTVYSYGTIHDTVYATSGTAHAQSYVFRDTIRLFVSQSDTILKVRLDSAIRELQIKDTEIYTIQQECDKSKFEKILDKFLYIFVVVAFIVLIQFFIKIFK